ncbi:LysM peptidoglycan-binding domain-containing protein [Paenibacillus rigui]|uniref:LysM domain-containing protein n=1 Tax=Paenibacillus rigui TaxID=554312 RepID=A0A229UVE1_9BACL|nr:LysM peptidoglycan-binding domain-containing protein [Paenibacillus rigui]OXM86869.1 hypothetical protein CF651_08445 [Paenibacillus rigui]
MAEQQSGLRFDIYERVHLSEGVAGIKELEDVELVPHIQVLPQGDQALLRGNLLLSGTYVDEQDAVNRTLEHLIPVEITLPMNRVQRVEDIAVEIENFDVDLLSTRSLNITGVLSLNGLEVVSAPAGQDWQEVEEEVVFVHEVPDPRLAEQPYHPPLYDQPPNNEAQQYSSDPQFTDPRYTGQNSQGWPGQAYAGYDQQHPQQPQYSPYSPQGYAQPYAPQHPSQQEWSNPSLAYAAANPVQEPQASAEEDQRQSFTLEAGAIPEQDAEASDEEPAEEASLVDASKAMTAGETNEPQVAEEKKELKIAFTGKKEEEAAVQEKPIGLTSLLQSAVANKNEMRQAQEKQNEAEQPPANANDKLEWKKLLLSSMNEQQEFRRVRLCIVQKEETLEIIAKRYDLNPREIALFNRLGDTDLSEGQVVYIPK